MSDDKKKIDYDDYGREIVTEKTREEQDLENLRNAIKKGRGRDSKGRLVSKEKLRRQVNKLRQIAYGHVIMEYAQKRFCERPKSDTVKTVLRGCMWARSEQAVLENRRIWVRKDGTEMYRNLMGFTIEDIEFVCEHKDEIIEFLKKATEEGLAKQREAENDELVEPTEAEIALLAEAAKKL